MKYLQIISCAILMLAIGNVSAQERSEKGYFLVESESFSPPIRDLIKTFEGFPATPFLANDMMGEEQFLNDFRGKACVLYFWSTQNSDAVSLLYELNLLKKKFGKKVNIVAMADESREEVASFLGTDKMELIVIPNTRMLSEAVYGVELGYPRVFFIDANGIIQSVIPEQFFDTHGEHKQILEGAIKSYL